MLYSTYTCTQTWIDTHFYGPYKNKLPLPYTTDIQGGPKKSKPDNFCNNFVYCQPIFIIFDTHTLEETGNRGMYS